MRSPWKSFESFDPDREYLVFASSIPARDLASTGQMFRGSRAVRAQLSATEGVIGFALLARPLRKQYATLSVWRGEDALNHFTTANPHGELMAELAPSMGPTKFVRWTISGLDGRPSWRDALDRLGV